MKLKNHILPLAVIALGACSENVPPDEEDCLDDSYKTEVRVSLHADSAMVHFAEVDSTRVTTRGDPDAAPDTVFLRYCVAAYRRDADKPCAVQYTFEPSAVFKLTPDRYRFVGWATPEREDNGKSKYFHTDDFEEFLLRDKYSYKGNDLDKMALRGVSDVRIGWTTARSDLTLKPAMGRLRIVATDTADYKVGKVTVRYKDLPGAVHGPSGAISLRWDDVRFSVLPQGDVLCHDHVLAHDDSTTVSMQVDIYDEEDVLRNRVKNLTVPVRNGGITTVKANFYSIFDADKYQSGTGITIQTEFDETIIIEV